jgi:hypothetical protein
MAQKKKIWKGSQKAKKGHKGGKKLARSRKM